MDKLIPNLISYFGQDYKKIIYLVTDYFDGKYVPFDFDNDESLKTLIHEICYLIKGYDKLREENWKIIDSTGLMKTIYSYDSSC